MSNFGSNGRFGNQLFQYCFLYSMAKKLGLYFFIPKIDLFNRYFDINRLSYVDINLLPKIKTVNHIEKSEFIYNKFNIESSTINNFSGYFQCFDYIYSNLDEIIKNELVFNESLLQDSCQKIKDISGNRKNICSIHIRKGDYLIHSGVFYSLKIDYYIKAMSIINKKYKDSLFLVFSDDIDLVKKEFNSVLNRNIIFMEKNNDIDDFFLMVSCPNKIISNSTFSLWSAIFNKEKGAVVCPIKWLNNDTRTPIGNDVFMNWIKI